MKVLAFDLSTTESGWCFGEEGKVVRFGTIKPSSSLNPIEKLIYTIEEGAKLIRDFQVDDVVVEDIYCAYVQAHKILGRLQGAMIFVWWKMKFRAPFIYSTTSARANIGIKGNAKKKDVMKAINKMLKLKITNDNEADAIVLALNYFKEQENGRTE